MSVAFKIVFMVYDSRSGSTLLARELSRHIRGVYVTPEISFDRLVAFGTRNVPRATVHRIIAGMLRVPEFRNVGMSCDSILAALPDTPYLSVREVMECIMSAHIAQADPEEPCQVVIIKNGSHVRFWRQLYEIFGSDLRFIFVYRDPRAVVNSKLRTQRPYYKREVMAWGGSATAAFRWGNYCKAIGRAKDAGVSVIEICYEEFLSGHDAILRRLADSLGLTFQETPYNEYRIPETEHEIHQLVLGDRFELSRSAAWQRELKPRDVRVIEASVYYEMTRRGYKPSATYSLFDRAMILSRSFPTTAWKVIRHYGYHLLGGL